MRALAAMFLVGCLTRSSGPPDPIIGDPSDPSTGACNGGRGCDASLVCTRDDRCLPSDQVRAVHVTWTVAGAAPTAASCAAAPDLALDLRRSSGGHNLEFAPVPCVEGRFSVDRLSMEYDRVALRPERSSKVQDAAGNAALNLAL
jgi:hypothetical protein